MCALNVVLQIGAVIQNSVSAKVGSTLYMFHRLRLNLIVPRNPFINEVYGSNKLHSVCAVIDLCPNGH